MPRNYSQRFVLGVQQGDQRHPGTRLAMACIRANIPAVHVAKVLGVSRVTVFNWFRGKSIGIKEKSATVDSLATLVENDLKLGILPAANATVARKYLSGLVGFEL